MNVFPPPDTGSRTSRISLSRRALDVVVCSVTLVLVSPLMAVVAVLVRVYKSRSRHLPPGTCW